MALNWNKRRPLKTPRTHTDQYLFVVLVDVAVGELLPAQLTLVWFIFTVDDLVSRGLIQTLEAPAADVTGVRTLFYTHVRNNKPTPSYYTRFYAWNYLYVSACSLPECVIMCRFN